MPWRVKTLQKNVALPDGNVYPHVNTIVELTDDEYDRISQSAFDQGVLEDLGEFVTSNPILVLGPADPVPGGTPSGTIIFRTA